ncbi:MAG: 5'-nucleotidase C-terminal domain-containing protein [Mesonia hippocampi]|uniref:5'-nucleotidase C-terminal domain-containing protein n=1 Tax=Mesonia hippocampi TaxID=1628250 RepID=UPI003F9E29B3
MIRLLIFFIGLSLFSCAENKTSSPVFPTKIEGKQVPVSAKITEDKAIKDFIAPYKERIDDEMNKVLSYTPKTLSKTDGEYNTPIGNMMADAVLEMAQPIFHQRTTKSIDAVLLNHGGIRANIDKGDITTKTAYNIMPFENEVVIVEITGAKLNDLFTYLAKAKRAHPIAGMQLILDKNNQVKKATIQGKPVDKNKTYYIATSDFLQQGGDNMLFFAQPKSLTILDYKLRNLFIDYFSKHPKINPIKDQRFIKE